MDVRQSGEVRSQDMVEFQAQVAGQGAGAQAVFGKLLELPDWKLAPRLERCEPTLRIPAS